MILIGRMAKDYGMLPSMVEKHATTFDIMVTDMLATYDNYQQQKANGKIDPKLYGFSQDELMSMVEQSKNV